MVDPFGPRTIYNSKSILNMGQDDIDKITACSTQEFLKKHSAIKDINLIDIYTKGYVDLGAKNPSAIKRMAELCTIIFNECLPIPPSPFSEFLVGRTSGMDKLDVSFTVEGDKGDGKSYTSFSLAIRYAMDMAAFNGGSPLDYFTLDNCALLEDTKAITRILQRAKKRQFLIIDDSQVAIGNRDFALQKNKNFNKILSVCRTMRWVVCLNSPMASQIDLGVRELTDFKIGIYKPFHANGFNLVKINSSDVKLRFNKKKFYEKRLSFFDRKFDLWCAFHPDIFEPYKGYADKYDVMRDEAARRIIDETADMEEDMADPRGKREKKWDNLKEKMIPIMKKVIKENGGEANIRLLQRKTGCTSEQVYRLLSIIENGGE